MAQDEQVADPEPEVQVDAMREWRVQAFELMGFAEYAADLLASRCVSPHDAQELLDRGCPLDLALKILL